MHSLVKMEGPDRIAMFFECLKQFSAGCVIDRNLPRRGACGQELAIRAKGDRKDVPKGVGEDGCDKTSMEEIDCVENGILQIGLPYR